MEVRTREEIKPPEGNAHALQPQSILLSPQVTLYWPGKQPLIRFCLEAHQMWCLKCTCTNQKRSTYIYHLHSSANLPKPTSPEQSTMQTLQSCLGQSNRIPVWLFLLPSGINKAHLEQQGKAACHCSLRAELPRSLHFWSLARSDKPEATRLPRGTLAWGRSGKHQNAHVLLAPVLTEVDKSISDAQQTGARCPHCDLPTLAKASLSSSSSSLEICMVLAISWI